MNKLTSFPLTLEQTSAISDHIRDTYGDDEDLIAGMVEGETDAGEWLDVLIDANADDATLVDALKAREADMSARRKRIENRVKARREGMKAILDATGLPKWERPLATLSLRNVAPKPVVQDESALPDEFCRITRKPDMAAIKAADELPEGVTMDNGGVSLTVRTK